MEDNTDLPYEFTKQAIIAKAEKEADKLEPYDFGQGGHSFTNTRF